METFDPVWHLPGTGESMLIFQVFVCLHLSFDKALCEVEREAAIHASFHYWFKPLVDDLSPGWSCLVAQCCLIGAQRASGLPVHRMDKRSSESVTSECVTADMCPVAPLFHTNWFQLFAANKCCALVNTTGWLSVWATDCVQSFVDHPDAPSKMVRSSALCVDASSVPSFLLTTFWFDAISCVKMIVNWGNMLTNRLCACRSSRCWACTWPERGHLSTI